MTLEEIENLDIEKHKMTLAVRLFNESNPHPEPPKKPSHDFDYIAWTISQFTQEQFESELIIYKAELVIEENERLRKLDIENRFKNLKDMRAAFHSKYPNSPNPALFIRDLLNNQDHLEAENKIKELEILDDEIENDPKKILKEFIAARNKEYQAEGVTRDIILEALWEAVVENRPEKIETLQPIRERVKEKVKKP